MKKLIVAVCAIAMAVCANAATTKWSITTGTGQINAAGTTTALTGTTTAYIFCLSTADTATTATIVDQASLLTAIRGGGDIAAQGHVATAEVVNGKISSTPFTSEDFAAGKSTKMYFAILTDDDQLFISGISTKTSNATSAQILSINPTTASSKELASFDTAYGAAGWYSTADVVPEPTSGLLLLLGMAGLALRRRRA